MRRVAAALALSLLALVAAGCEDTSQRAARRALQAYLRTLPADGGYRVGAVHCSRSGRLVLDPIRTRRFLCTARRADGGDCDWFRVDARRDGMPAVSLRRSHGGCVLPSG